MVELDIPHGVSGFSWTFIPNPFALSVYSQKAMLKAFDAIRKLGIDPIKECFPEQQEENKMPVNDDEIGYDISQAEKMEGEKIQKDVYPDGCEYVGDLVDGRPQTVNEQSKKCKNNKQWPSFLIPSIIVITTLTFIAILLASREKHTEPAEPHKQIKRYENYTESEFNSEEFSRSYDRGVNRSRTQLESANSVKDNNNSNTNIYKEQSAYFPYQEEEIHIIKLVRKIHKWPNGDIYKGRWANDMAHGFGTYTVADGTIYKGQWKYDKRDGQGTYTGAGYIKYVGKWKDGQRSGWGTHTGADGIKYEGKWKDDKFVE